jgi:DNA-directed RNA polymerase subunit RPC12/RpoP
MRDLQLVLDAAKTEKIDALGDWESDYQAAQERRRIEIGSIARDLALGYPLMDAEEAQEIAETGYGDALARGFTRLADAIKIASDLADEWWNREVYPYLTTTTVRCPACNAELELTSSDIPEHNRVLNCPQCGAYVNEGFSLRWVYEPEPIPPIPTPPIAGVWDWVKKYAPWMGVAGAGAATIYVALKKR